MKVIVIGGGIAGLSIGWRLAQAGAEVVLFERAQPGRGATLASAGMLAPAAENGDRTSPEAVFGRASAQLWPAFAAEVQDISKHNISYRPEGALLVAASDEEMRHLRMRSNAELLSPSQARAMEPTLGDGITGALFDPDEAQVDNRAIGLALARAFVRAGGNLQANETVVRLEIRADYLHGVLTQFASHRADAYVLAAGAWTGQIEGLPSDVLPPVVPVKGEMIALEGGALPSHVVWGNGVYLVPRHRQLFVGATMERVGFDTSLTTKAAVWLRERAAGLMPGLADWRQAEHWAGLRPGSPDDLPILGETAIPRLYVAGGQFRNGILLAPAMAEVLRSLILERRSGLDISAFDPRRFTKALVAEPNVSR
ncbi:MAG TPA: glycine oxidase ThiO [Rhizomicrobium sp.]|jgi:glycine oxidase